MKPGFAGWAAPWPRGVGSAREAPEEPRGSGTPSQLPAAGGPATGQSGLHRKGMGSRVRQVDRNRVQAASTTQPSTTRGVDLFTFQLLTRGLSATPAAVGGHLSFCVSGDDPQSLS